MLNLKKTCSVLAGMALLNSSHGMWNPSDQSDGILASLFFSEDQRKFLKNISYKFLAKGKSKSGDIKSGGLKKGLFIYPTLLTSQEKYISLSNYQGVALQVINQANVAVGYLRLNTDSEIKEYPVVWIKKDNNTYNQFIDTKFEGQYSCINETGTWTAGRYNIETETAVIKNIKTEEIYVLGPGRILEMTWDGTFFYGVRVIDDKKYACVWERKKDNSFEEYIITDSKGLDSDTLFLDPETQDFITYQKRGRLYRWSKLDGVVELIN